MFRGASAFNSNSHDSIKILEDGILALLLLCLMFAYAYAFKDIGGWDVSSVTNM